MWRLILGEEKGGLGDTVAGAFIPEPVLIVRYSITYIVRVRLDVEIYSEEQVFFYVLKNYLGYDLILGLPWLHHNNARFKPK
ncbi:hypothetical protein BO71DRAFT_434095 [Aspergillus ellipticus CBS 707.79]|uniref:Uncharacterized protein n=1 Tax=Aspergillus ellipticus CBS 707.79 TaxID=1448320 RepID=A0A319CY70_9EURO|nr:hypothetical protein BO71DRAFT_434095 [Aspergillus ellipticus CBS 707.79]